LADKNIVNSATDILLALLYAPGSTNKKGEPIKGYTRLEKLLFLLSKETELGQIVDKDYEFEPKDYGPCSEEIYDDVEMLKDARILQTDTQPADTELENVDLSESAIEVDDVTAPTNKATVFQLTEKGMTIGSKLFQALSKTEQEKLSWLKTLYNSRPISEVLRYVYTRYPETTTRSTIREEVLADTE
jgi:uncharacterized protein YwgA